MNNVTLLFLSMLDAQRLIFLLEIFFRDRNTGIWDEVSLSITGVSCPLKCISVLVIHQF